MSISQRFIIRNEIDIISTRMAVREFARRYGFNSRDQACISLASSSLASSLGLGKESAFVGLEILIEYFESGQKKGMRVVCTKQRAEPNDWAAIARLKNSYSLVDDIQTKPVSQSGIEVTVTKWNSSYIG